MTLNPHMKIRVIALIIVLGLVVVLVGAIILTSSVENRTEGGKSLISMITEKVMGENKEKPEVALPDWAGSLQSYTETVKIAAIPQNTPAQFTQNLLSYFPLGAYNKENNSLQLGVIIEDDVPLLPKPDGYGIYLTPNTNALLKTGQAFWRIQSVQAENLVIWNKVWTFEGDDGFISEVWRFNGLGMKIRDFVPPRVCVGADGSQLYTPDGQPAIYISPGAILQVTDMHFGSIKAAKTPAKNPPIWFKVKAGEEYGELLVNADDCWLLTEDLFYYLYLAPKPLFSWAGLYKKTEDVQAGITRHKWFLLSFPQSEYIPQVLHDCAQLMALAGDEASAKVFFARLEDNYPDAQIEPSFVLKKKEGQEGEDIEGLDEGLLAEKPELVEILPRGTIDQNQGQN